MDNDFNLPADRITKILKLLQKDFSAKKHRSEVDELYISELKYAINQINSRKLYMTTEKAMELMQKHESMQVLKTHKADIVS